MTASPSANVRTSGAGPFFSIVIPAFNSEKYIERTLNSVFDQTYTLYEVIVCDDGSSDNTVAVIRAVFDGFADKSTLLIVNAHEGPGAARNRGIEAAKYEWISFLDADDSWLPHKLRRVAEFITENPEVNLICHNEIYAYEGGESFPDYSALYNKKISPFLSIYRQNPLSTSAVVVRKELLIRAGMFDVTLPSAQDLDMWLRISMLPEMKLEFITEALGFYLPTVGNISSNVERRLECMLRINGKYCRKLKELSRFPVVERLRYEGKWYVWAGMKLIKKKETLKGAALLLRGIVKWPFRFDVVKKIIRKTISQLVSSTH